MSRAEVCLYHAADTRSLGTLFLLEELGIPYDLHPLSFERGEHKAPEYLAINPLGKVPAIRLGETVVTEQGAIMLHLGDLFADHDLCPRPGDRRRGVLLRWMFYYGSCFEPAMIDRALKREPGPALMSPYGTFDGMFEVVVGQLAKGPWFLGEHFTIADALWGTALTWMLEFGLMPQTSEVPAYVARIGERPAFSRARAIDARLVEEARA